ncbi:MAG: hypothetical protein H7Y38_17260, partial [Armatimonadetes bacterium]|nr:hypothetical protein [Armatimonadota bacterium]
TLREQCTALDLPAPPELLAARQKITELGRRITSDPLGVAASGEREIATLLSAARAAIETNRTGRETARAELGAARRLLAQIAAQDATVAASFAACAAVLDTTTAQPGAGAARLHSLEEWLTSLEASASDGEWQAVAVGLSRWMQTAQGTQDELMDAERANQSLLDLPSELRGRHAVLCARMRAIGSGDVTLSRLAEQARTLLDAPRLPVERTTKLIEACEERLRREQSGRIEKK